MIVTGGNSGLGRETVKVSLPNRIRQALEVTYAFSDAAGTQRKGLYRSEEQSQSR
jgi:NAD(P)-dependent dehydrogenase (short-subunit alcohol dehydrogenase family)